MQYWNHFKNLARVIELYIFQAKQNQQNQHFFLEMRLSEAEAVLMCCFALSHRETLSSENGR